MKRFFIKKKKTEEKPGRARRGRGLARLAPLFITAIVLSTALSPLGAFRARAYDPNSGTNPNGGGTAGSGAPTGFGYTLSPNVTNDNNSGIPPEEGGGNTDTSGIPAAEGGTGPNSVTQDSANPGAQAAALADKSAPPNTPKTAGCIATYHGLPIGLNWDACAANIVYMIMWIFSWILWLAGKILDMSIYYTINMADLLTHVPVVDIGWKIFRDLANIFFIFILLWMAIGTILGLNSGKTKELLVHLIIVALLMNFSLFITKVVIDASNIVAIHFYNLIVTPNPTPNGNWTQSVVSAVTPTSSFSGAFMEGLKIQSIYNPQTAAGQTIADAARAGASGALLASAAQAGGQVLNMGKVILIGLFGIALMMVAAYVFLVAAILFIIRAVVLMMVMLLSPLGFLAFAMPATEKYAELWKEKLISQSLFAPLYLALSFVVVKTIQSPAFSSVMSVNSSDTIASAGSLFNNDGSTAGFAFVFNFILLIGLMLASILVAKKLGAVGVEAAVHIGKQARGFVGRNIVRAKYVSVVGGAAGLVGRGAERFGFKDFGKTMKGFEVRTDKLQKKMDMAELDKKFRRSAFGATSLGDFIREKTTGGALFGTGAKFGGEKTVKQAYEEDEKLRERRAEIENMEFAEQQKNRFKIAKTASAKYEQPSMKQFAKEDGSFDRAGYGKAMKNYLMTLYAPKKEDFANDTDFEEAKRNFETRLGLMAKGGDFAEGSAGDRQFVAMSRKNAEVMFEKPSFDSPDNPELMRAKKIADKIEGEKEEVFSALKIQQSNAAEAVARIDPSHFADMDEDKIKELAPLASVSQLKAVKDSTHWTVDEKKEMVGIRWEEKFSRVKEFDEENEWYNSAMQKVRKAAIAGKLETDEKGNVLETTTDSSHRKQIEFENGIKYAVYIDDTGKKIKLEMPEEPEMPRDLIHWIRNEMTLPEFEIAAAFKPEMYKNKSFMSAVRFPIVFKEFRTNQNWPAEIRDLMTYLKNAPLDLVRELSDDSEETSRKAFEEAIKASKAAADKDKDRVFRQTFTKLTPANAIKTSMAEGHAHERSEDELTSSRSRDRLNPQVMSLYGKKATKLFAPKDIKDVLAYFKHLMLSVQNEIDHKGLVSQQNREAIKYLFTDVRSADVPRQAVGELPDDLKELYYKLQKEGEETGKIVFESDQYRNLIQKKASGSKRSSENETEA